MVNGVAQVLSFIVTESREDGLFVYKTQTAARDAYGDFNIEARGPIAWPNEGIVEIKKSYVDGATYTLMGTFSSSKMNSPGIDLNQIPQGYSYFNGVWMLNLPKTEAEAASIKK